MNKTESFDLATLPGLLRTAAARIEDAVRLLEAAGAAERLLAQVREIDAGRRSTELPRSPAMPAALRPSAGTKPIGASRGRAVFHQDPVPRADVVKIGKGASRSPI